MASLRTSMLHLESLKHLDIGNCGCQDSDVLRKMFDTLLSNHEVDFVNFCGNQIDGMYAELLKDAPNISHLRSLGLVKSVPKDSECIPNLCATLKHAH